MTVVLGAVAAVVFVGMVAALLAWRAASARASGADSRLAELVESAERAQEASDSLSRELSEERGRRTSAEARAGEAEGRAGEAEARATGLESEVAALRSAAPAAVLCEVERVRLEREWSEVAGPGAALPVAWDGTIAAVLAIELEIIREVIGTPSRLEDDGEPSAVVSGATGPGPWIIAGIGCETLRAVARSADELVVRLDPGPSGAPRMVVEALGAPAVPDLASIEAAAKALGFNLSIGQTADSFMVWLSSESSPEPG